MAFASFRAMNSFALFFVAFLYVLLLTSMSASAFPLQHQVRYSARIKARITTCADSRRGAAEALNDFVTRMFECVVHFETFVTGCSACVDSSHISANVAKADEGYATLSIESAECAIYPYTERNSDFNVSFVIIAASTR